MSIHVMRNLFVQIKVIRNTSRNPLVFLIANSYCPSSSTSHLIVIAFVHVQLIMKSNSDIVYNSQDSKIPHN
jgi:hypothetical protein